MATGNGKDKPGESEEDKKAIEKVRQEAMKAWEKKHPPEDEEGGTA